MKRLIREKHIYYYFRNVFNITVFHSISLRNRSLGCRSIPAQHAWTGTRYRAGRCQSISILKQSVPVDAESRTPTHTIRSLWSNPRLVPVQACWVRYRPALQWSVSFRVGLRRLVPVAGEGSEEIIKVWSWKSHVMVLIFFF